MSRIDLRAQAEADIDRIVGHIAVHHVAAAHRFLLQIWDDMRLPLQYPGAGGLRIPPPRRFRGLRIYPVTHFRNYLILYRATIDVIRVIHGARSLPKVLRETE